MSLVPDDDFAKDAVAQARPVCGCPALFDLVHPKYTSDAMRAKIQGQVVTQVVVGDGRQSRKPV